MNITRPATLLLAGALCLAGARLALAGTSFCNVEYVAYLMGYNGPVKHVRERYYHAVRSGDTYIRNPDARPSEERDIYFDTGGRPTSATIKEFANERMKDATFAWPGADSMVMLTTITPYVKSGSYSQYLYTRQWLQFNTYREMNWKITGDALHQDTVLNTSEVVELSDICKKKHGMLTIYGSGQKPILQEVHGSFFRDTTRLTTVNIAAGNSYEHTTIVLQKDKHGNALKTLNITVNGVTISETEYEYYK